TRGTTSSRRGAGQPQRRHARSESQALLASRPTGATIASVVGVRFTAPSRKIVEHRITEFRTALIGDGSSRMRPREFERISEDFAAPHQPCMLTPQQKSFTLFVP